MKDRQSHHASGTAHLVERQMLLYNARRRLVREHPEEEIRSPYHFVTISREIGALGDGVASELATRLQWHVFDKEIVDYIAEHTHVRQEIVRQMSESTQSLIHDTVGRLLRMAQGSALGKEEYHVALVRTLATLAAQRGAVILGHGGAFALQGQPGLHARIFASLDVRVRRLAERWHVPPDEARRRILQIDEGRRDFIHSHFRQDREDPRFFDFVFNTDRLTVPHVVAAIMSAMQPPETLRLTTPRPRP